MFNYFFTNVSYSELLDIYICHYLLRNRLI